jgi:hypothetical protein
MTTMTTARGSACATTSQDRQFDTPSTRQAPGPFEGYRMGAVDVPLRIRDLSVDGCLIELHYAVVIGRRISLQIELPCEGWIALRADTLRVRHSTWLAAKFVTLDASTRERLARAIERSARPSPAQRPGSTTPLR